MRRLTRSILGFGWAVPVFGLEQLARLGSRHRRESVAETLEQMTALLGDEIEGAPKGLYRLGSTVQDTVVDFAFGIAGLAPSQDRPADDPDAWVEQGLVDGVPGNLAASDGRSTTGSGPGFGADPTAPGAGMPAGGTSGGGGGWGPVPSKTTLPWPEPTDGWGPMPADDEAISGDPRAGERRAGERSTGERSTGERGTGDPRSGAGASPNRTSSIEP